MKRSYGPRHKVVDAGLLVCVSIGALYMSARIALRPHNPAEGAAVIFAPWTSADRALLRAVDGGGRFVRFGGASFIAVVTADRADYPDRMLNAGAWLVVDPQALAGCSSLLSRLAQGS